MRIILARLDASHEPRDMNLPGLRLHPVTGNMEGFWAVDVSGNWRIRYTPCLFKTREAIAQALAEVHTELMLIHPFREGNGRFGRLLATLMGLQAGLPPLDFSDWAGTRKEKYFAAVRAGVDRDYEPTIRLFVDVIEKSSF